MSKKMGKTELIISRVCDGCGRRVVSRKGVRMLLRCPSCEGDMREPLITVMGTTAARRKEGRAAMLALVGMCKTGKTNISETHDKHLQ